jgi:hypothetical protein
MPRGHPEGHGDIASCVLVEPRLLTLNGIG